MFKIIKDTILGTNDKKEKNEFKDLKLRKSLEDNTEIFKEIFNNNDTVIFRKIKSQNSDRLHCCLIFMDGMVEKQNMNENIVDPIMKASVNKNILETLKEKVISAAEIREEENLNQLVIDVLYGNAILLIDGYDKALLIDVKGWEKRSISGPETEMSARGPQEGFTESINSNLSMIRRKILDPALKFQFRTVGTRTKTKICLCYIQGLASEKILKEIKQRLDRIEIDGVLESGYIEELIKDAPLSPFKTTGYTERPDVVAANLLEGRIAIVCDGTPFVLTIPFLFMEYFQANEDYYNNFIFASINRLMRVLGFFLSTSIPAIYVALITYHQEMIPTPLLIGISAAREGVPFPTIFEALGMLFVFEILREAGVRLPKPFGQSISIVGALVLGQAAVEARFVSAPMVIITALTGISTFLIPKMLGPLIVIRFIFLILASFLGLYGYIFGVIGLFIHLMSIRSFGIPYMLNVSAMNKQDIKDTAIRAPWWYMYYRPKLISERNSIRRNNATRYEEGKRE